MKFDFVSKNKGQFKKFLLFVGTAMILGGFYDVYKYFEYGIIKTHAKTTVGRIFGSILSTFNIGPVAWVYFWLIIGIVIVIWSFKISKE